MDTSITAPIYSFVQLGDLPEAQCLNSDTFCIPISKVSDLQFQFKVTALSDAPPDASNRDFFATLWPVCTGEVDPGYDDNMIRGWEVANENPEVGMPIFFKPLEVSMDEF